MEEEKAMATHSSTIAWKIPWTGEPGGLPSMGSHRVRHNWSDLAAAAAAVMKETNRSVSQFKFKYEKKKKLEPRTNRMQDKAN